MPRRFDVGLVAIAVWLFALLDTNPSRAEDAKPQIPVETISSGSSLSAARKKALAELPLNKVAADLRPKLDDIVKNISLFRRMPTLRFTTDPDVYQFFIAHPDAAASSWRVMEISTFELNHVGPANYEADSHDGSTGTVEVLHSSPERQLVLCVGSFKSPLLLRPIKANALLHLQPVFHKSADGQTIVTHSLDMFVSFPSQPIDITAKLISPVSHSMADRNFREVSMWVAMMNVAMSQQPEWIDQVARQMQGVSEQRRVQLLKLALQTSITARKRAIQQGTATQEVSLEEVTTALKNAAAESTAKSEASTIQNVAGEKTSDRKVETAGGKKSTE